MNAYSGHPDPVLLALLRQSNDAAFAEIYHRYWKRLFSVAANQLQHPAEAEELVQDLFLDLWARREQLHITSSLNAYLSVAVNYKIINVLAKRSQRQRFEQQLAASPAQQIDQSTEHWLAFEELRSVLEKRVADLPQQCRLVFTLSRRNGLSRSQIAGQLGIAEKTVEAHLTKALKALRGAFGLLFSVFFYLH